MTSYLTLPAPATAEIIIKKSRFIGLAAPLRSADEASALLAQVKKTHWDASHNVWAYSLREGGLRRYSDDGEPQGTAGLPVLDVLQKRGLVDCAVIVTRYFGGTLLGAGGLVRAYSQAAGAAIDAAGVITMALCSTIRVRCDYSFYGRLQGLVPAGGGVVTGTEFAQGVTLTFYAPNETAPRLAAQIIDASNGGAVCEAVGEAYRQV